MALPRYQRVLLKISGESICSPGGFGIDSAALSSLVDEIRPIVEAKVQLTIVIGAGNFIRGRDLADDPHVQRVTADHMGMLGTVINALALRDTLEGNGIDASVLSAFSLPQICEPFIQRKAMRHLVTGRVLIMAGGTGSPFFTTDMCAALRANELGTEVLLKATKVDGVFDADPMTCPQAKKYDRLTYDKAIVDRLGVMDLTAISMCMESHIPIIVFQLSKPGNLLRAVSGEEIGTVISD